jgi:hypothetical protein
MMLAAASIDLGTVWVSVREEVNTNYPSYSKCQKICPALRGSHRPRPQLAQSQRKAFRFELHAL